jgi:DNA transformation protein and related proteins
MRPKSVPLLELPNLGEKIVAELRACGIGSRAQLARVGPAQAYVRLCLNAGRRLPRCYYLYSLSAALRGVHWNSLTLEEKRTLCARANRSISDRAVERLADKCRRGD